MSQFLGRKDSLALFGNDVSSVVIDTDLNLVVESGSTEVLSSSRDWIISEIDDFSIETISLVESAISAMPSDSLVASATRLYTIPAGVQAEAKKALAWHAENHRGGTPVGLGTARTLAEGGQVGIAKIRHIAKYFPRHQVDSKAKGYKPGEDGFPSNGRIAWGLWGGDAGRKWAQAIVDRDNKSSVTASVESGADLKSFSQAYSSPESTSPEFLARVRLDGSGIDRLYKIDLDASVYVWDGNTWDNFGSAEFNIWDFDKSIDSKNDTVEKSHILIDPDSAIIIAARFESNPFKNVSIADIDADEARLATFAVGEEDWDFIDSAIIADASSVAPTSTSEKSINMDGIFDRSPADSAKPQVVFDDTDNITPPMDADAIHEALANFPAWVNSERKSGKKTKPAAGKHHPIITNWVDKVNGFEKPSGSHIKHHDYTPDTAPISASGNIPSPADVKSKIDSQNKKLEDATETKTPTSVDDTSVPANTALTPKTSDVHPLYFAVVASDDPRAVENVIAVVPASSTNSAPMVYSRNNKQWQRDPKTLADLQSPTPPPVVPLEPKMLNDVLIEVDGIQASALFSYDHALMVMFGPKVEVMSYADESYFSNSESVLVAAKGGLDKNYGNADKLRHYWVHGGGAAKIRWGMPGDWSRCVRHLSKYLGVRAKGYCQLRHHDALGIYTATHAKLDRQGKGVIRRDKHERHYSNDEFIMEEVLTKNYGKPTIVTEKDMMMPMDVIHSQHDHMYDENWSPEPEIEKMLNDPKVAEEMCNYSASDHSADDPCWDGYKQIGFKDKDGRHVPNCVKASAGLTASDALRHYWTAGIGSEKIRWGEFGDWTRCVRNLDKYLGSRSRGYCALRHQEMTGSWVGDSDNKQLFSRIRNESGTSLNTFSTEVINSSSRVLEISSLSAKASELKNRVSLVASGVDVASDNAPIDGASFKIPLVIPEGIESGDGRIFDENAITTRELPLPLLWQIKTGDGHSGSVVVGRIDHMERIPGGIGNATGVFDTGIYGKEAQRLLQGGFLKGVSADMDQFEAKEFKRKPSGEASEDDSTDINNGKLVIKKARVMGVTIVPKPAFQECKILLSKEGDNNQEDTVIPNGVYADDADSSDAMSLVACGMVASSIPVTPPAEWFENPKLAKPTPLTVDDSGRVFGHIAAWHVDHIGLAFGTKPPRSRSNYSYFHTGVVRAENGKDYPVGQLTLAGGHASLEASAADAVKHYDDTASAIADVHAGEDQFGIWVAGALRPNAQPEQIRALRASAPSGDWRPIQGSLELVAVCQVNVPGFPIARARVASGAVMALVAAGASTLAKLKGDPLTELSERLSKLESANTVDSLAEAESIKARFSTAAEEFGYIPRAKREESAKKGHALPDGSFPIENEGDVKKAIHAYGRAKESHKAEVRKHIIKRAKALKVPHFIPDDWKTASSESITASLEIMRSKIAELSTKTEPVAKEASIDDIRSRVASIKAELASNGVDIPKVPTISPYRDADQEKQDKENLINKKEEDSHKYTPQTQPRSNTGEFRKVLARLKGDLHLAGLHGMANDVHKAEQLHIDGKESEALKAGQELFDKLTKLKETDADKDSIKRISESTKDLGKSLPGHN